MYVEVLVAAGSGAHKWKSGRSDFQERNGRRTKMLVSQGVKCDAKRFLLFSLTYSSSFVNPFIQKIFTMHSVLSRVYIFILEGYKARRACQNNILG